MNINPERKMVSDTYPLNINEEVKLAQKTLNEMLDNADAGEVVAFGPEDHLKALRDDLLKAGYKKLK